MLTAKASTNPKLTRNNVPVRLVAHQTMKTKDIGCPAQMSVNSTANSASNEPSPEEDLHSGTKSSSMVCTNRRSSVADHRRYGISLQLALGARHRCLLATQDPHREFRCSEPSAFLSNALGWAHRHRHSFGCSDAVKTIAMTPVPRSGLPETAQ